MHQTNSNNISGNTNSVFKNVSQSTLFSRPLANLTSIPYLGNPGNLVYDQRNMQQISRLPNAFNLHSKEKIESVQPGVENLLSA